MLVEQYNSTTRVALTEAGWLYQIGRMSRLANRSGDQRHATSLQEKAAKMVAASFMGRERKPTRRRSLSGMTTGSESERDDTGSVSQLSVPSEFAVEPPDMTDSHPH